MKNQPETVAALLDNHRSVPLPDGSAIVAIWDDEDNLVRVGDYAIAQVCGVNTEDGSDLLYTIDAGNTDPQHGMPTLNFRQFGEAAPTLLFVHFENAKKRALDESEKALQRMVALFLDRLN